MKYLNHFKYSLLACLLLGALASCENTPEFPCVKGDGARITEARTITEFSRVSLNVDADVYLHQGGTHDVSITAQENIIAEITTEVAGEVLEIHNTTCLRQEKTIRIDITLPVLAGLEVDGPGDVYGESSFTASEMEILIQGKGGIELTANADKVQLELGGSGNATLDLQTDVLISKVKGTGDLHLSGTGLYHNSTVNASGNLNAFDFISDHTDLIMKGAGDANVHADSILTVDILGTGNVFYKGRPSLNVKISGSGEVKDAN
ncbi:MAG: head GIN domain-containing protein [Bacteroidota bacterium]